ncbi:MAG: DUF2335 domain-containing protein [Acidobacteriota bacterium]
MNPDLPDPIAKPIAISRTEAFSGPLPPPSVLRDYEEFVPGSAERIIAMAEKQGDHRRRLESEHLAIGRLVIEKSFAEARAGQVCAVIVCFLFLAAGIYLAIDGREIAASVIGGAGMAAIVTAFLTSRKDSADSYEPASPTAPTRKENPKKTKSKKR